MREGIGLYRGKQKDNGEWVYGYLGAFNGIWQIFVPFSQEDEEFFKNTEYEKIGGRYKDVIPETVGQYIGLPDENSKKMFEGDILKTVMGVGYVVYGKGCFCVQYKGKSKPAIDIVMHNADVFVIGNIHDNPELLQNT